MRRIIILLVLLWAASAHAGFYSGQPGLPNGTTVTGTDIALPGSMTLNGLTATTSKYATSTPLSLLRSDSDGTTKSEGTNITTDSAGNNLIVPGTGTFGGYPAAKFTSSSPLVIPRYNSDGTSLESVAGGPTIGNDGSLAIGTAELTATRGLELITSPMVSGGWTLGTDGTGGWGISGGVLSKTTSAGSQTALAVTGQTAAPVVGSAYEIIVTTSAVYGEIFPSLGGVQLNPITAAGTRTFVVPETTSTAKLSFSSTSIDTCTITAVSVKLLTSGTGDLTVEGKTIVKGPVEGLNGPIVFENPTGQPYGSDPLLTSFALGTNPAFVFSVQGTPQFWVGSDGGLNIIGNGGIAGGGYLNIGSTSGDGNLTPYIIDGTEAQTGTGQSVNHFSITPTYNQPSATSVANTDFRINRTETNLGTTPGAQKFVDLQVATASKFSVDTTGLARSRGSYAVPYVICQSAVPVSVADKNAATVLYTCSVPANSMGKNGSVWANAIISASGGLANNKSVELNWINASTGISNTLTSNLSQGFNLYVQNRNATNSQLVSPNGTGTFAGGTVSPVQTTSVDTTQAQNIVVRGTTSLEPALNTTAVTSNGTACTVTVASGAYATGAYVYVTGITMDGATPTCANVGTDTISTVQATNVSGTQFSYPCTCANGTSASIQGTSQEWSKIQLERIQVVVFPGAD